MNLYVFFCFHTVITELRSCDWNYVIDEYLWNILDFSLWPAVPKIVIIWLLSGSEGKASACNAGDLSSIPGSGRSPGEGNGKPLSTLAWKIPWMEEPGRLQSMGSLGVGHD